MLAERLVQQGLHVQLKMASSLGISSNREFYSILGLAAFRIIAGLALSWLLAAIGLFFVHGLPFQFSWVWVFTSPIIIFPWLVIHCFVLRYDQSRIRSFSAVVLPSILAALTYFVAMQHLILGFSDWDV